MSIPFVAPQSPSQSSLLDLTGKARIRQAALQMFASKGYAQASLRRIAQRANVSLALIGHHFGSKLLLREAIDQWVVRRLGETALTSLDLRAPLPDAAAQIARAHQATLDAEPDMRAYLCRTILEDARGDAPVLAMFLEQVRYMLSQTPDAKRAAGADALVPWSTQIFVQVFGPLVLEPALRRDRARHTGREPQSTPPSADEPAGEPGRSFAPKSGAHRSGHADTAVVSLVLAQRAGAAG